MIDEIKLLADEANEQIALLEYDFKWGNIGPNESSEALKVTIAKVKSSFADSVLSMFPDTEKVSTLKSKGKPNIIHLSDEDVANLVQKAREIKAAKKAAV